jgi:hypothetical protein
LSFDGDGLTTVCGFFPLVCSTAMGRISSALSAAAGDEQQGGNEQE